MLQVQLSTSTRLQIPEQRAISDDASIPCYQHRKQAVYSIVRYEPIQPCSTRALALPKTSPAAPTAPARQASEPRQRQSVSTISVHASYLSRDRAENNPNREAVPVDALRILRLIGTDMGTFAWATDTSKFRNTKASVQVHA